MVPVFPVVLATPYGGRADLAITVTQSDAT